ncbi:hypothetical protein TanjilG_06808 [Lupinus angustifolius]|uniref:Uncharacterized protein n=1 Tax=Lupinus angustifolius TaxID=3871 RepID=A0A1J7H0F7_LUPAN|nr:PREDICTED: uncharacterized protein LOC109330179 [Lupinus angustifolius]OIV95832.1 hypothetical protein TanjilG_06808 [Lupinus angustifolius]
MASLNKSSNPNSRSSELSDPMRRSFTGNPFSKPSSLVANSRTFVPTTPVNTPTDSQRRKSVGGREVAGSFFHLDDKENGKDQFLKASKVRSPAAASSKSAKNFMSPTISAASKVTMSPKKKVLVERNEPVPTSGPFTTEAKSPVIRKVTFAEPLHFCDLKLENGVEEKEFVTSSIDVVHNEEIHFAELSSDAYVFDTNSPFTSKNDIERSSDIIDEPDCVILDPSFKLSPTSTPPPHPVSSTISTLAPLDADPLMPPYDPKTNYLSPRPQFLHYRPKARMGIELEESLMSGSFSDTEVTEDTQSEEGSQKSEDFSSDEVIEEEAVTSQPSPTRISLAKETVEAREVPKPRSFTKSKAIIALLLFFSALLALMISVSVTNTSVVDHAVFQDFYKVHELSDLSASAKANFDRFSEFAKVKFDVSARNFHTWYTKSLSSISELIYNVRGMHNLGQVQYYNLTVLQESNVIYQEPIFGLDKDIVEIEFPEVDNEESDTALESENYEDLGVMTAIASVPKPEEALESGQPATVIEPDHPLQVAEASEPNHSSEVDQPSLDAKSADIDSQVSNIGNLATQMVQECDAKVNVDKYSNIVLNDVELVEAVGVNVNKYGDVGLIDQPDLDSDVAEIIHTETIIGNNDVELTEAEDVSASIDAAIEDNEQMLEATDLSSHLVLYLLLCGGTILIAGAAFRWSRTNITSSMEQPTFAKAAAFCANSLATPVEDQSYLDKPSHRNGPTEIDLHEESCPSEMSSIQKSLSKRKVAKELNEVNSLDNKPKKRRESLASSSDYSISPSYGSFTTYDRIKIKNGRGEEEAITPVRRSSRVRSKATSPL